MGKGKYAALEKENETLKQKVPKQLKQLQASYEDYVAKKVEEAVSPYRQENEQLKQQLTAAQDQVAQQKQFYKDMQTMYSHTESNLNMEVWKLRDQVEQMKNNLSAFFNLLGDKTRQAISAIKEFAYGDCFTRFTYRQATIVNDCLLPFKNRQTGANYLILLSRPFISEAGKPALPRKHGNRLKRSWRGTWRNLLENESARKSRSFRSPDALSLSAQPQSRIAQGVECVDNVLMVKRANWQLALFSLSLINL